MKARWVRYWSPSGRAPIRRVAGIPRPAGTADDQATEASDAGRPDYYLLLLLLMDAYSWVHRRVERAVIESTGESTRHVSLDFSVPTGRAFPLGDDQVVVPLGVLKKGPLMRFSLSGPDGRPAPILERQTNNKLAIEALCQIAQRAVPPEDDDFDPDRFRKLCTALVKNDGQDNSSDSKKIEKEFRDLSNRLAFQKEWQKHWFVDFALGLQDSFLLLVVLDAKLLVGRRAVVKFSYQTDPQRPDQLRAPNPTMRWPIPEIGLAKSTHFEFSPPHLLLVKNATLTAKEGNDRPPVPRVSSKIERSTVHFVYQRAGKEPPKFSDPAVEVTLGLRPSEGALRVMRWGPLAVFAALLAGMVVRLLMFLEVIQGFTPGTGPAAALLAGGGLLLTWIARAPEDWVTGEILYKVRAMLEQSAMVAIVSACYLAVPFGSTTGLWWFRTVGWLLIIGWALYVWLESRNLSTSMGARPWPKWSLIDFAGRPVRYVGSWIRATMGGKEGEPT